MKNKKVIYLSIFAGLFTGLLNALFLSGKIINIPKGTHEGGIISAVGVLIIIVMTVLFNIFMLKLFNKTIKPK